MAQRVRLRRRQNSPGRQTPSAFSRNRFATLEAGSAFAPAAFAIQYTNSGFWRAARERLVSGAFALFN
jgi:hypothetical protein